MAMTEAVQEYLEALYWLGEAGIEPTPVNVSRAMQVSQPSVSEMLRRLERDGLVRRGPGKQITLTEEGERVAKHVVSRHRLVEAFLVKVMGVPWDEVHEEAQTFEMGVTENLERRMLALIGEAKTCPHGHPIGDYPREPGVPLTSVTAGSQVRVLRFENEDHDLLKLFHARGVEPRGRYTVRADPDDPDAIRLEGATVVASLPRYAARTISVSVIEAGPGAPLDPGLESLAAAYLLGESHWSR
jgi:DtxR family Mn-dependent transcriptional regulator